MVLLGLGARNEWRDVACLGDGTFEDTGQGRHWYLGIDTPAAGQERPEMTDEISREGIVAAWLSFYFPVRVPDVLHVPDKL
jgi:hypothetical protein